MLSTRPASIAGVGDRKGRLMTGYDAEIVVLDDHFSPCRTWVRGTLVPTGRVPDLRSSA